MREPSSISPQQLTHPHCNKHHSKTTLTCYSGKMHVFQPFAPVLMGLDHFVQPQSMSQQLCVLLSAWGKRWHVIWGPCYHIDCVKYFWLYGTALYSKNDWDFCKFKWERDSRAISPWLRQRQPFGSVPGICYVLLARPLFCLHIVARQRVALFEWVSRFAEVRFLVGAAWKLFCFTGTLWLPFHLPLLVKPPPWLGTSKNMAWCLYWPSSQLDSHSARIAYLIVSVSCHMAYFPGLQFHLTWVVTMVWCILAHLPVWAYKVVGTCGGDCNFASAVNHGRNRHNRNISLK